MQTPTTLVIEGSRPAPIRQLVPVDWPLWLGTAVLAIGVAVAVRGAGWTVAWPPLRPAIGGTAALLTLGAFYRQSGRSAPLARLCLAIAQSLGLAYVFQTSTYVIAASSVPLRSAALTRADTWLGFSWPAWTAWVHRHPLVWGYFQVVHPLHFAIMILALTVLALKTDRGAVQLLRAFTFTFVVSAIALALVPALTNTPDAVSNTLRFALRDGTFHTIDFAHTAGLISFPSMHAAMAVLAATALWPYRVWRWPVTLLALSLCIGAISEGGHYLVDILAGAPLGWLGWRFAAGSHRRT